MGRYWDAIGAGNKRVLDALETDWMAMFAAEDEAQRGEDRAVQLGADSLRGMTEQAVVDLTARVRALYRSAGDAAGGVGGPYSGGS